MQRIRVLRAGSSHTLRSASRLGKFLLLVDHQRSSRSRPDIVLMPARFLSQRERPCGESPNKRGEPAGSGWQLPYIDGVEVRHPHVAACGSTLCVRLGCSHWRQANRQTHWRQAPTMAERETCNEPGEIVNVASVPRKSRSGRRMAAIPMLRRNVKLEIPQTAIYGAFACQLHIPNNFTSGQECGAPHSCPRGHRVAAETRVF